MNKPKKLPSFFKEGAAFSRGVVYVIFFIVDAETKINHPVASAPPLLIEGGEFKTVSGLASWSNLRYYVKFAIDSKVWQCARQNIMQGWSSG